MRTSNNARIIDTQGNGGTMGEVAWTVFPTEQGGPAFGGQGRPGQLYQELLTLEAERRWKE
eukprot:10975298-Heterocapsa_arctica.AAC.1